MNNIFWKISNEPVPYLEAMAQMDEIVAKIIAGEGPETVWLLEHPPLYTAGTSADPRDLLSPDFLPVHHVGRGGEYTYHGPGQIVGYVMLDLKKRKQDLRWFVKEIEHWLIDVLAECDVTANIRAGRVGLWVDENVVQESKIAAIGIRVRKWVSFHGFALNVSPNLTHYQGIVPCGIQQYGVTSLEALGKNQSLEAIKKSLTSHFENYFSM